MEPRLDASLHSVPYIIASQRQTPRSAVLSGPFVTLLTREEICHGRSWRRTRRSWSGSRSGTGADAHPGTYASTRTRSCASTGPSPRPQSRFWQRYRRFGRNGRGRQFRRYVGAVGSGSIRTGHERRVGPYASPSFVYRVFATARRVDSPRGAASVQRGCPHRSSHRR